jgi:hypothetical protein
VVEDQVLNLILPALNAHGVALDEPAFIGFRAYMEPATRVGPINTELLYDRAIKFSAPDNR